METQSDDLFYQLIDHYENGRFIKAFQVIILHPDIAYDYLPSRIPIFQHLINYADSCVFYGALEVGHMNRLLHTILESDSRLRIIAHQFIEMLEIEYRLQNVYYLQPDNNELEKILQFAPLCVPLIQQKMSLLEGWSKLVSLKPDLKWLKEHHEGRLGQPWHQFSYPLPLEPFIVREGEVPLIFLESLDNADYSAFLSPYRGRQVIYVCESIAILHQLLHSEEIVQAIGDSEAILYILEIYPKDILEIQIVKWGKSKSLQPIFMTSRLPYIEVLPLLMELLGKILCHGSGQTKQLSSLYNWLYLVSKRLIAKIKTERYGKSRCFAQRIAQGRQDWFDPHKGLPPKGVELGPLPCDYFGELIAHASQSRMVFCSDVESHPVRASHGEKSAEPISTDYFVQEVPKSKIRIAHVVPQVVDGGHAPTRLLNTLLSLADQTRFELFLIVTEAIVFFPYEYPMPGYHSQSSIIRGQDSLLELKRKGIYLFVEEPCFRYDILAQNVASQLSKHKIDIAVFHGPDEINTFCGSQTVVPLRVLFDHGMLPSYPCFDLVIGSSDEGLETHREELKRMGMESCVLPFSIDSRKDWTCDPYSKEELGFPFDSFVMTTISLHLDTRLSSDMCHAIGMILKQNPKAIYAPIGPIINLDKFRSIFSLYGVDARVIFLGQKDHPSHYARSMELYLNEFPFGSGLGMLDAMSAGCPVVSMHDQNGPQQSQYGATYFGIDKVIKSGKIKEYVELACRLIKEKTFYQEWREYSFSQYAKRGNEQ